MSTRTVFIHRLARREFQLASNWYSQRSQQAAGNFRSAFDKAIDTIRNNPLQGQVHRNVFRWIRLRRFPYLVYYCIIDDDSMLVMAVAHSRRRPNYWARRFHP